MDNTLMVSDPAALPGGKLSTDPRSWFRTDEDGGLMVTTLHGKYRENTHRVHNFAVCTVAIGGQVTTVGLALTYTGLAIYNAAGSGVVVSIQAISTALLVAEAAPSPLHFGTFITPSGLSGALTPFCTSLGSATGNNAGVTAFAGATIVGPVIRFPLNGLALAGAAKAKSGPEQTDGLFELQPGIGGLIIATTLVTGFFAFAWTEIPL